MPTKQGEVTQLLLEMERGTSDAEEKLFPLVYGELRRLAAYYMRRERPEHTLQPTALVNEAYLRLTQMQEIGWQGRSHFFAIAAQAMRRILVDHARAHDAAKRGGAQRDVTFDEAQAASFSRPNELLALDEALGRLADFDPRQSRIVELRFFGGLNEEETAHVLGISVRTVKRDWRIAKAWLYDQVKK